MTVGEVGRTEGELQARSFVRGDELTARPLPGRFNVQHLQAIHQYLLQDATPPLRASLRPGQFRDEHPASGLYSKLRKHETVPRYNLSVYASMTVADRVELGRVLERSHPDRLRPRSPVEIPREIGRLYEEMDYIHPFKDANSRTLRVYTAMVASAIGYRLDWTRLGSTAVGRDALYMSRDKSLLERGLSNARSKHHLNLIVESRSALQGAGKLEELLAPFVESYRSYAFRVMPKAEALARYPDLERAYAVARSVLGELVNDGERATGALVPRPERLRFIELARNATADFLKAGRVFSPNLQAARTQLDQFLDDQTAVRARRDVGRSTPGHQGQER